MGSVLKRYFTHDHAADAYLGRVLAGLDPSSLDFGLLPPHFAHDTTVSHEQVLQCFPAFRARSGADVGVLRFLLPSLVHHHDRLLALLPPKHRLRYTRFFEDTPLRLALAKHVVTGLDSPFLRASGIPPHLALLRQGATLQASINQLRDNIIGAGATAPGAPALGPAPAPAPAHTHEHEHEHEPPPAPTGFPPTFDLPLVGPLTAWRLLVRGSKAQHLPPYRFLSPSDFPANTKLRKRISDWLFIFRAILAALGDLVDDDMLERLAANDDELELTALFLRAWATFGFDSNEKEKGKGKGRTTRPDQWKLNTAIQKIRQQQRQQRAQTVVQKENEKEKEKEQGDHEEEARALYVAPRKRAAAVQESAQGGTTHKEKEKGKGKGKGKENEMNASASTSSVKVDYSLFFK
jgi:hypothetical protein